MLCCVSERVWCVLCWYASLFLLGVRLFTLFEQRDFLGGGTFLLFFESRGLLRFLSKGLLG